jgi:catechol 2,3-dioxygenase-like lactoylglutathione lyase family enzyme
MRCVTMPASDLALGPIGQVSLLARDISRVEAFYRDTLGLPHVFTFGDLAFFDAAGTRLYVRAVPDEEWRPGSILYFSVDDIRAAFAALEAKGVHATSAPQLIHRHADTGVEEWMAFFDDGEGNTLAIKSKVPPDVARTAAP